MQMKILLCLRISLFFSSILAMDRETKMSPLICSIEERNAQEVLKYAVDNPNFPLVAGEYLRNASAKLWLLMAAAEHNVLHKIVNNNLRDWYGYQRELDQLNIQSLLRSDLSISKKLVEWFVFTSLSAFNYFIVLLKQYKFKVIASLFFDDQKMLEKFVRRENYLIPSYSLGLMPQATCETLTEDFRNTDVGIDPEIARESFILLAISCARNLKKIKAVKFLEQYLNNE